MTTELEVNIFGHFGFCQLDWKIPSSEIRYLDLYFSLEYAHWVLEVWRSTHSIYRNQSVINFSCKNIKKGPKLIIEKSRFWQLILSWRKFWFETTLAVLTGDSIGKILVELICNT